MIQRASSNSNFALPDNETTNSLFDSLIQRLEELYGTVIVDRIADLAIYIEYSFRPERNRFIGFLTQIPKKYALSQIDFYRKRKYGMVMYENEWLSAHGMTRKWLIEQVSQQSISHTKSTYSTIFEDSSRRRFLNTKTGYVYCHIHTSGWDATSMVCCKCIFANDCKNDLRMSHPDLFFNRTKNNE